MKENKNIIFKYELIINTHKDCIEQNTSDEIRVCLDYLMTKFCVHCRMSPVLNLW